MFYVILSTYDSTIFPEIDATLAYVSRHLNCHNERFMIMLANLFCVHLYFCVRLVRCVLDATGMLPSMDDVYVHCGPSPSTIWGMSIMSQNFCQFPASRVLSNNNIYS